MATSLQIRLTPEEIAAARALADQTYANNKRRRGAREHYPNTPKSHIVGKVGEFAAARALASAGLSSAELDCAFRSPDREGEADILVRGWRLDVKTWSEEWWIPGGRCVRPNQVGSLRDKADCVVWCSLIGDVAERRVVVQGWSTIEEVVMAKVVVTGPPHNRLENHQLSIDELRDFTDLVASIKRGPPAV